MIDEYHTQIFELQNQEGNAVGFSMDFAKYTQLAIEPIYVAIAYQKHGYSQVLLERLCNLQKAKI